MEHLLRPAHKLVEEFLLAKRREIQNQLEYRWLNSIGKDVSDILRGKLEIIDTILNMKNVFKQMDDIEAKIKNIEKEGAE